MVVEMVDDTRGESDLVMVIAYPANSSPATPINGGSPDNHVVIVAETRKLKSR